MNARGLGFADVYTYLRYLRLEYRHRHPSDKIINSSMAYEIRPVGEGRKKQSMAELKLRRLTELNTRLREDLDRHRIPVSEAAFEYVDWP